MTVDFAALRKDFPLLDRQVHGKPLVYLDNAATTQKPECVLAALERYYRHSNANVHRGVHALSEEATAAFEGARETVRRFLNAREAREIVFVRGTTEAINLVAQTFGQRLRPGDEVLITAMEHHSNIVPWQLACAASGAQLRVAPVNDEGDVRLPEFERLLGERTRIVAVTHVSNALGTVNPLRWMIELAHARGVPVLVDGAQSVAHFPMDVQALDCDFFAFSGHKVYGPTGIGVLYGKADGLEALPPWQGGGEMIRQVTFAKTTYAEIPHKFEAGTPDMAGAVGLAAALDYLEGIGREALAEHERGLLALAEEALADIAGLRIIGTAKEKAGLVSFVMEGVHPHDIGTILDREGVAVRTGHHCAMPVMERLGVPATVRASFALYNTPQDVESLLRGLHKVKEVFRG